MSAAPDPTVKLPPEQGFQVLHSATGSDSISDHDLENGKDLLKDLVDAGADQGFVKDSHVSSFDSAFTDALAAVSEKIGSVTSSDSLKQTLQGTLPGIIRSQAVADVLGGGAQVLDSEPTAGTALDYPNPVGYGNSVLSNLFSVAAGNGSSFNDSGLIQSCHRLQTYFTQNQFYLNATQQNQVQYLLSTACSQQPGPSGARAPFPNMSASPGVAPAPKAPPAKATPVSCHPHCNR